MRFAYNRHNRHRSRTVRPSGSGRPPKPWDPLMVLVPANSRARPHRRGAPRLRSSSTTSVSLQPAIGLGRVAGGARWRHPLCVKASDAHGQASRTPSRIHGCAFRRRVRPEAMFWGTDLHADVLHLYECIHVHRLPWRGRGLDGVWGRAYASGLGGDEVIGAVASMERQAH
jgi:hypothetical protein